MSRKLLFAVLIVSFANVALANDGEALFKANGCTLCHHPQEDKMEQGLGPSLQQIADAYGDDSEAMRAFLRGNAKPRVYPDHYVIMKAQLTRVAGLSDEHLNAIVEFILRR